MPSPLRILGVLFFVTFSASPTTNYGPGPPWNRRSPFRYAPPPQKANHFDTGAEATAKNTRIVHTHTRQHLMDGSMTMARLKVGIIAPKTERCGGWRPVDDAEGHTAGRGPANRPSCKQPAPRRSGSVAGSQRRAGAAWPRPPPPTRRARLSPLRPEPARLAGWWW